MAPGTPGEVLRAFARLGLTSFGGPVAHLAWFRAEFVERRRWLDDRAYADLVALSQFLPGPASSKLGFALGLLRAGWPGALAAWFAFTLPSALLLLAFAYGAPALDGSAAGRGLLHGLKLSAVAIVAHATWAMARTLCPDGPRRALALVAAAIVVLAAGSGGPLLAVAVGAAAGALLLRGLAPPAPTVLAVPVSRGVAAGAALAFAALLVAALLAHGDSVGAMAAAFYRAGALVFGGGHVVLPMLDAAVVAPGWVEPTAFLAGYGAAQAVPGPLFAYAAFLGAQPGMPLPGPPGAALALLAIFVPGLLLQVAALPYWAALRAHARAAAAIAGVNAAVVGVLAAALWNPVWTGSVGGVADALVALAGVALLASGRVPALAVVALTAAAGVALALAG